MEKARIAGFFLWCVQHPARTGRPQDAGPAKPVQNAMAQAVAVMRRSAGEILLALLKLRLVDLATRITFAQNGQRPVFFR